MFRLEDVVKPIVENKVMCLYKDCVEINFMKSVQFCLRF